MELRRYIGILAIVTTLSAGWCFVDTTLFAVHPLSMTIGFVMLMTFAILTAVEFRLYENEERLNAIKKHMIIQFLALLLASIGFLAIYFNKIRLNKDHFTSYHGKMGLLTMVMTWVSILLGVGNFQYLGIYNVLPSIIQYRIKLTHRRMGAITWILSLITIFIGVCKPKMYKEIWTVVWQWVIVVLGVVVVYLLMRRESRSKTEMSVYP